MARSRIVDEAGKLGIPPEQITEFILQEWKRPVALCDQRVYRWQFVDPPGGDALDHSLVSVTDTGEIDGFLGLYKTRSNLDGRSATAGVGTTWVLSESARRRGLAKRMLDYLMNRYDILLGAGINDLSMPIFLRQGFRLILGIPRYVRIINAQRVIDVSEVTTLGKKLIAQYDRPHETAAYQVEEIAFDQIEDELASLRNGFNFLDRSCEQLIWRYRDHPMLKYRTYRIHNSSGSAILVIRVDRAEALSVMHVMDLFGSETVFPCAIDFVDFLCREEGADLADFFCVSDVVGQYFWRMNWFSTLDDVFVKVPHLFHPVELRDPPTTSLAIWCKHQDSSFYCRSRFYLTKQDCDLDRPLMDGQ